MQATAQIVSKLRNARFDPGKGAKEKLAWINDTEADLLRALGGSGKRRKFGLPSFSWRDNSSSSNRSSTNDGSGGSRDARGNVNGTGSGSGAGGRGGLTGQRGGVKQTARVPTPRAKPALVAPPVYTPLPPVYTPPPVFTPPPPVFTPPTPRMKPAAPVQATVVPQNYGFVSPPTAPKAAPVAATPTYQNPARSFAGRVAAPTPTYQNPARSFAAPATRAAEIREARAAPAQPQNFGFQAPDRPVTSMREEAARRAAASRRAEQQSQYRSPPGDQRLAQPSAPVQRQDFGFQAPARPAAGVPTPRQNPLRDTTKIRTDASFNANTDFGKISGETLSRLAALQDRYGKPITVTEGAAPGSTHVSRSQHHVDPRTGKATALDISVPTRDRARVASLAHDVGYGGIGAYGENLPNMIHVDSGKRRSWGPGGKAANIGRLTDRQLQAVLRDRTRARSVTKYAGYDD